MRKLFYAMSFVLIMTSVLTGCSHDKDETPVVRVTVSFDTNGGSTINTITVKKGATITKPTNPINGTMFFVDWFKEAELINTWDFSSDVVNSNIKLYAKWTIIEYNVTFVTNGGTPIDPVKVPQGAKLEAPQTSKEGEAFDKWYSDANFQTVYDFSSPVIADITLYAKWIAITKGELQELVVQSKSKEETLYTPESYGAMKSKEAAAEAVVNNQAATQLQITNAYNELEAAIMALVLKPEIMGIRINISEIVNITAGQSFNLQAYATYEGGGDAANSKVTFSYQSEDLMQLATTIPAITDNSLSFTAKSPLAAGIVTSITISSVEKPSITRTITLKTPEAKTIFIAAVTALPDSPSITYANFTAIDNAVTLYGQLSDSDKGDIEVSAAITKLNNCKATYNSLSLRFTYSKIGEVEITVAGSPVIVPKYKWINNDFGHSQEWELSFELAAGKQFPEGVFTSIDLFDYQHNGVDVQRRLTFANGKITIRVFDSVSPGVWGGSIKNGIPYTYTGDATSGELIITYPAPLPTDLYYTQPYPEVVKKW